MKKQGSKELSFSSRATISHTWITYLWDEYVLGSECERSAILDNEIARWFPGAKVLPSSPKITISHI
jgi:hypothetical protein